MEREFRFGSWRGEKGTRMDANLFLDLRYGSGHRKGRLKILSVYALVRNAFQALVRRCAVSALRRVLFRERRSRRRMGKSQRQEVGFRWIRRSDLTWPRTPVRGFFIP